MIIPKFEADTPGLREMLNEAYFDVAVDGATPHVSRTVSSPGDLNRMAFEHWIVLRELRVDNEDVEDVFVRLRMERWDGDSFHQVRTDQIPQNRTDRRNRDDLAFLIAR